MTQMGRVIFSLVALPTPQPPISTLFPYTTLFRSKPWPHLFLQRAPANTHAAGHGWLMTTQHCPHPHRGVGHWPVAHALPAVNVHGAAATNAAVLGPAPVMPRPATAAQRDSAAAHPQEQTRSTTAAPEYRPHKINFPH